MLFHVAPEIFMIATSDIPGFFASLSDLNSEDYLKLDYLFQTHQDPKLIAAMLCCEQSTAQWRRPGCPEDFRPLYGAKVLELKSDTTFQADYRGPRYFVRVAHPHRNFGPRIPNLLSAAAGEGPFYCPGITSILWTDFDLPFSYLKHFEGPQFGKNGVRKILQVFDRPVFIGVVKPNIGLPPAEFAQIAYESWKGGLDIAKDDEMLADIDWSPIKKRIELVSSMRMRAETEAKSAKIFIANITDEIDSLSKLYETVVGAGANAVMINSIFMGMSALRSLRRKSSIPIMSHFTGTACLNGAPGFGISSRVLTKIERLAGADLIVMAGFGERMKASDEEVLQNIDACLKPWGSILPSLPVPGGSDSAKTLSRVFAKIGHVDFGFIAGRGVYGHPSGPMAGARSLHQAWEAILKKIPVDEYAKMGNKELMEALEEFGK